MGRRLSPDGQPNSWMIVSPPFRAGYLTAPLKCPPTAPPPRTSTAERAAVPARASSFALWARVLGALCTRRLRAGLTYAAPSELICGGGFRAWLRPIPFRRSTSGALATSLQNHVELRSTGQPLRQAQGRLGWLSPSGRWRARGFVSGYAFRRTVALGRSDFAPTGRNYLNAIRSTKGPSTASEVSRSETSASARDDRGNLSAWLKPCPDTSLRSHVWQIRRDVGHL